MAFKLPVTRKYWLKWFLSPRYRRRVRAILAEQAEDYDAAQAELDATDLALWEKEFQES